MIFSSLAIILLRKRERVVVIVAFLLSLFYSRACVCLCYTVSSSRSGIIIRTLVKSAYQKIIFLFLNQNICYGYSKEPSQ